MTAAERKVRERYPHRVKCERTVAEYAAGFGYTVRLIIDGERIAIGCGRTGARAWADAVRSLPGTSAPMESEP